MRILSILQNNEHIYIINPPNIAHSNWIKFNEKPFLKNEWFAVGFVSDTLERKQAYMA